MTVLVSDRRTRPACFIDRDGTVMADTHYPSDPDAVRLIPGVAEALAAVNARDIPVVIITNQGGIARGFLTESQYQSVRARLDALLHAAGVSVLDTYHCPHWEPVSGPCACRKPAPGMYRRAAADHDLDVTRSVFIGDRWRDVKPGLDLGGLGVLVPGPDTSDDDIELARTHAHVVPELRDAMALYFAFLDAGSAHAR
jgi:D-glycero-D-manno-heptose 1,7-bisphosphate phosphatase